MTTFALTIALPDLSLFQILVGLGLFFLLAAIAAIWVGARLHDIRSNAPAEPEDEDEVDLFSEWAEQPEPKQPAGYRDHS